MPEKEKKKFSLSILFIKLTSRALWVWLATTGIVCYVLYRVLENPAHPAYPWMAILLGIWGGTAALFIGGNVLIDALAKSVEKASISLQTNINATANTNLSGTVNGNAASGGDKRN